MIQMLNFDHMVKNKLIKKMTDIVGFNNGDGKFVTGGTQANLVAVLSARNALDPNIKKTGLRQQHDLVLFISDQAHYSYVSAANVLGLGVQNIIRVKTDGLGRMDAEALEVAIQTAIKENKEVIFSIDLKAALDDKKLDNRLIRDLNDKGKETFYFASEAKCILKLKPSVRYIPDQSLAELFSFQCVWTF